MRLLIVDDSAVSRSLLKDCFLGVAETELAEAVNGIESLNQHRLFKPQVIFLDFTMPELDGLSVLKIIRAVDKHVKVVFLSPGDQARIEEEALQCGADAILEKPVNRETVLQAYHSVLQTSAGESG